MRRIIICGGGFCGQRVASRLQRSLRDRTRVEILLVDPAQSFLFTPMLIPMVVGLERVDRAALPWARVLDLSRVQLVKDQLVAVDSAAERVRLEHGGWLGYDALILAFGSASAPGRLPGLRTYEDGLELKTRLVQSPEALTVLGGGPVGCELAAALSELTSGPMTTLLEAQPRLLTSFVGPAEQMAYEVQTELSARGVDVQLDASIDEKADGAWLGDTRLSGELVDCRGGRPPLLEGLPAGRLRVNRRLRLEGAGEVYVGGDLAEVDDDARRGIGRALSHGQVIAENVHAGLTGRARVPLPTGSESLVLRLGEGRAVGVARGLSVTGSPAWTLRQSLMAQQSPALNQKLSLASEAGVQAAKQSASWLINKLRRR